MNICIKGISVTLHKCNGATLRGANIKLFLSAPPQFGIGLAVADVAVACWIFARVYRYSVRTGLIARYSAESVT